MRRSRPLLVLLVALAATALAPSSALAATTSQVVADCNAHGRLVQHYSEATLRNALATLPADVAEYTDCPDVIRRQLLAQVSGQPSGSGSAGSSGGSFLPTWVIVLLIIVILGGAGATVAARRRAGEDGGHGGDGSDGGDGG